MSKRRCKYCKEYVSVFIRINAGIFCSHEHAVSWAIKKSQEKREKAKRAEIKKRKQSLKTKGDLTREAQIAFNSYIRQRDKNKECISSGRKLSDGGIGGGFDAGHYRSVGSAPNFRFCLLNVHGQSKHDNNYLGGNIVEYRKRLIKRIGIEAVEKIEADNKPRHYSRDDLTRIKKIFAKRAKLYEKKFRGGKN